MKLIHESMTVKGELPNRVNECIQLVVLSFCLVVALYFKWYYSVCSDLYIPVICDVDGHNNDDGNDDDDAGEDDNDDDDDEKDNDDGGDDDEFDDVDDGDDDDDGDHDDNCDDE